MRLPRLFLVLSGFLLMIACDRTEDLALSSVEKINEESNSEQSATRLWDNESYNNCRYGGCEFLGNICAKCGQERPTEPAGPPDPGMPRPIFEFYGIGVHAINEYYYSVTVSPQSDSAILYLCIFDMPTDNISEDDYLWSLDYAYTPSVIVGVNENGEYDPYAGQDADAEDGEEQDNCYLSGFKYILENEPYTSNAVGTIPIHVRFIDNTLYGSISVVASCKSRFLSNHSYYEYEKTCTLYVTRN